MPFLFISKESKTVENNEVYNQIKFIPGWQTDTWIMRQSHQGLTHPSSWDRLAIVVDKSQKPYEAKFYQLKPGEMVFEDILEYSPYRAPCFSCHANGPRAIRPKNARYLQSIKVGLLNLRIKSYFQVESLAGQPATKNAPFRREHEILNTPLGLETCAACHKEQGFRKPLTLDHASTAKFLIDNEEMPPWPFSLKSQDREALTKWGI